MATAPSSVDRLDAAPLSVAPFYRCGECGARLAPDQRYCVECGARRGPLPRALAERIGVVPRDRLGRAPDSEDLDGPRERVTASPSVIAVAVMALLAFGVLVGSAVSPVQESGADAPILVAVAPPATSSTPPPSAPPSSPSPAATPEATTPEAAPEQTAPANTKPASTTPSTQTGPAPTTTQALPPIKHVFLIVLSDQGVNASFGPSSPAPYLSKTLTGQGELLNDYYAVTGGELANEIALISGQGPTPQTAANCPLYTDITPGTVGELGQVLGSGCVYPSSTLTVGDQLTAAGKTWKAYVEGIGGGAPGQPATCAHPTLGSADANQTPTTEDPYVTWRDPFVYFHSVIDSTTCASSVVGLGQLAPDLKTASQTPSLSYIVPDRCDDGSEEPCAPGKPAGLLAADGFLEKIVPQIESSAAYKAGGLIAITSDQAPQSGPNADSSGCCVTAAFPNLPPGTSGTAGTTGTTGTTTAAGTTATAGTTSATGTAGTTSETGTAGTTGNAGVGAGATVGGGKVGLLLISKYVKPGSVNVTGEYSHFSLLASIESLFGLSHLGYAGSEGLLVFDKSVYNNPNP